MSNQLAAYFWTQTLTGRVRAFALADSGPLRVSRRGGGFRGRVSLLALVWLALVSGWGLGNQVRAAVFDFDTGTPLLAVNQRLPLDQTASGVTAHYSASSGGFAVETSYSILYPVSSFTNQFLYPAGSLGSVLEIRFSEMMTNISFPFATLQIIETTDLETPIRLDAYTNSTASQPVGGVSATGVYGGGPNPTDPWPQGILNFTSAVPFNLVRISVPNVVPLPTTGQAYDFLVDNITVQRAGGASCLITATSSPAGYGSVAGTGGYSVGLTASLMARPLLGYVFTNWTENGTVVSASNPYEFIAKTNRNLSANFTAANFTVKAAAVPFAGGSTTLTNTGSYAAGTILTGEASAKAGYGFVNWSRGVNSATATNIVSTSPSYTFVVNSNFTVLANFQPGNTVALSAWPADGGAVSGGGIYPASSNLTVSATASPGYAFINWQQGGAVVSSSSNYTRAATSNLTLVANFDPVLHIARATPGVARIYWPYPAAGFQLLQNSSISGTNWVQITNVIAVGGLNQVNCMTTGRCGFYRLFHP